MACDQRVRVWSEKGVDVAFKLLCKDKCKATDADDCSLSEYGTQLGAQQYTVQYCACNGGKGEKAAGCQIVLYIAKGGDDDGKKHYRCDGNECAKGEECLPVPVPNSEHDAPLPTKDGKYRGNLGKRTDYKCECKPKPKPPE